MNTDRRTRTRTASIPRRILGWVAIVILSLVYYLVSSMLMLFGYIVGWDNDPGRPWIGLAMIAAGAVVFVFMPRLVKRLTGREVLTSSHFYG